MLGFSAGVFVGYFFTPPNDAGVTVWSHEDDDLDLNRSAKRIPASPDRVPGDRRDSALIGARSNE
jgi:hypothetical protein